MIRNIQAVLAIDVGSSKISGAIVDKDLKILHKELIASRDSVTGLADQNLERTKTMINSLKKLQMKRESLFSALLPAFPSTLIWTEI